MYEEYDDNEQYEEILAAKFLFLEVAGKVASEEDVALCAMIFDGKDRVVKQLLKRRYGKSTSLQRFINTITKRVEVYKQLFYDSPTIYECINEFIVTRNVETDTRVMYRLCEGGTLSEVSRDCGILIQNSSHIIRKLRGFCERSEPTPAMTKLLLLLNNWKELRHQERSIGFSIKHTLKHDKESKSERNKERFR